MLGPMQSNTLQHCINRAVLSTIYEHMVVELRGWGIVIYVYIRRWNEDEGVEKYKHLGYKINEKLESWRMAIKQRLQIGC